MGARRVVSKGLNLPGETICWGKKTGQSECCHAQNPSSARRAQAKLPEMGFQRQVMRKLEDLALPVMRTKAILFQEIRKRETYV